MSAPVSEEERAHLIDIWSAVVEGGGFLPGTPEQCVDALIAADLPLNARFHFEWRWTPQPPDTAPEDVIPFALLPKWLVVIEDSDE